MKLKLLKLTDTLVGKPLCWLVGYWDYLFNCPNKERTIPEPRKILVIRPGGMGDFLYLLPALQLLRRKYPQARLDVLAESRNRAVQGLSGAIGRLLLYDAHPLATLAALRSGKYDLVIDSEQFHNFSALFAYLTGAPARIGFKTVPFRNHLYTHLVDYSLTGFEAGEFAGLLAPLGIETSGRVDLTGAIDRATYQGAALPAAFTALRQRCQKLIVIAPRGGDKYREWGADKYRQVVTRLLVNPAHGVVIVGGKQEAKLAAALAVTGERLLSLVGQTELPALCRIIADSDLFIGADSGLAVLANVLGQKSVTIFGATDHRKWAAPGQTQTVINSDLPCAPCYHFGSHKLCRNIDCLAGISADRVGAAVDRALS
ncbi:MAG: glycosyltransferase family 9 protein [Candidatus Margulisiibacteriota bacterium]